MTYQPIKKMFGQTNMHFASVEEFEKFKRENPDFDVAGIFGQNRNGLSVMFNVMKQIIHFANEFDRYDFVKNNKEYEIEGMTMYNGKPSAWVKPITK